jgi:hypothetical protein
VTATDRHLGQTQLAKTVPSIYWGVVGSGQPDTNQKEQAMLTIDMTKLSDTGLEKIIAERCSQFGSVASLTVMLADDHCDSAVAFVSMSTADQLDRVATHIGDSRSDSFVFIRIERERRKPPYSSNVVGLNNYLPAL